MRRIGKEYDDEDSPRGNYKRQDALSDAEYAARLQAEENAKFNEYRAGQTPTVLDLRNSTNVNRFEGHASHPLTSYATSLLPTMLKNTEKTYQTAYGKLTDEELARKLAEEPVISENSRRQMHDQFFEDIPEISHQPIDQQKRIHTPYYIASHDADKLHILDLSSNVNPRNTLESKINESEPILGHLDPSQNNDLEKIIKIWKTTPSKNLIDKILVLLKDYTGNNSRIIRFFTGKLNRNHIDIIEKIINAIEGIKNSERNLNDFTDVVCGWTLKCLFEISLNNDRGTLATIRQFLTLNVPQLSTTEKKLPSDTKIPDKYICQISQDIYENPVTDEYKFDYENEVIQRARRENNICPFDRRPYVTPAEKEFPKNYQLQLEVEIFKAKCLQVDNKSMLRL